MYHCNQYLLSKINLLSIEHFLSPFLFLSTNISMAADNLLQVFSLNSTSGYLTVGNATLNFEAVPVYTVKVKTTDYHGLSYTGLLRINITDQNEAPVGITLSNNKVCALFIPDNNHMTQENTGGVWFFIAATPNFWEFYYCRASQPEGYTCGISSHRPRNTQRKRHSFMSNLCVSQL